MKGQISIPIALVGSLLGSTIIGLASYYGAIDKQVSTVGVIDTKVEVLKTQQIYTDRRLESIEVKIDALLSNRGINPETLTQR